MNDFENSVDEVLQNSEKYSFKPTHIEINYIIYTIHPTDSIRSIADRFGVTLDELVKLNPQVCTNGKQEGIKIKVPLLGNARSLYYELLKLYGSQADEVFKMLCKIAETNHHQKLTLDECYERTAERLKCEDLPLAFDIIGVIRHPMSIYQEYEACIPIENIPEPSKRLLEIKEMKKVYDLLTA